MTLMDDEGPVAPQDAVSGFVPGCLTGGLQVRPHEGRYLGHK
jgi:hypothetical protein